jgi:hypothetical protein
VNVASEKGAIYSVCGALYSRGNRERLAEKTNPPFGKWLISNRLGMLRHTAGCSFYQGQCQANILIALYKPEIIDLETAA